VKRKFTLIISIVLGLLIVVGGGILLKQVTAKEQKSLREVLENVGLFVRSKPQSLRDGLNLSKQVPPEKVVAWVDDLPISYDELQFRLGLCKSSGLGPQTLNGVFKEIVEEKVIQKEAIKLGIAPTDEEITSYLDREKEMAKQDPAFRSGIEKIIASWNLTEDEYWNLYERYNITRLITLDKLSRHIQKDYYRKKEITLDEEKQAKQEWDKYVNGLLSKAEIKINSQFGSLGLSKA
jgi:hypothetical protein